MCVCVYKCFIERAAESEGCRRGVGYVYVGKRILAEEKCISIEKKEWKNWAMHSQFQNEFWLSGTNTKFCSYQLLYWRRQWHPTPVLWPGKPHGRRSLVGCRPWGLYELDTTERLHVHFSLSSIGGGNGNPLQCSWLENPRDGGAWWAAVYGVAQSRTRLKRLSSGSSSCCTCGKHRKWQRWDRIFFNVLWFIKNVLLSHRPTLSLQPTGIYPRVRSNFLLILFSTKVLFNC